MKIITHISVFLGILMLFVVPPSASGQLPKGYSVEKVVQMYRQRLSLTPQQTTKVRGILAASYKQMQKDKAQYKNNKDGYLSVSMERMAKTDLEIMRILTPEQVTKYQALKQEYSQKHQKAQQ